MATPFSNRPHFEGISDDLFGFGVGAPLTSDVQTVLREYANSIEGDASADGSVWTEYAKLYEQPMAILRGTSAEQIDNLAADLYGSTLTHGFGQGAIVTTDLRNRVEARMHVGALTFDRFYRLAEAVGAVRVKSAKHGQVTIPVENIGGIMESIEERIGVQLPSTRQSGSLFGLRIRDSIYSERHFDGMYAAWRLRELMKDAGVPKPSLLEIGGGAGFLSFYARILGFQRIAIIDLPHPALVQYIVLASEFRDEHVAIGAVPKDGIGLIGTKHPLAEDFTGWNAVVNVDSIPEMPPSSAAEYLSRIKRRQVFLSINQESKIENGAYPQNVVSELAAAAGLLRRQRNPSWLRTGYVEEVYSRGSLRLRFWA